MSIEKKLSIVDCLIMSDRNTLMIPGCSSTCITGNNDIGNSDSDNDIAGIESNDEEVSAIADTGAVAIAGRVAVATRVNNQVNSVATRVNKEISFMTQHEFTTCPRAGQNRGEKHRSKCSCLLQWKQAPDFERQLREIKSIVTRKTAETNTEEPVSPDTIADIREKEKLNPRKETVATSIVEKISLIQSYRNDSHDGKSKKKNHLARWAETYEKDLYSCIELLIEAKGTGNSGIGARYTFTNIIPNQNFCIMGVQTILGFSDSYRKTYFGKEGVTHDRNIIVNNHIFLAYIKAKVDVIIARHGARGKTNVALAPPDATNNAIGKILKSLSPAVELSEQPLRRKMNELRPVLAKIDIASHTLCRLQDGKLGEHQTFSCLTDQPPAICDLKNGENVEIHHPHDSHCFAVEETFLRTSLGIFKKCLGEEDYYKRMQEINGLNSLKFKAARTTYNWSDYLKKELRLELSAEEEEVMKSFDNSLSENILKNVIKKEGSDILEVLYTPGFLATHGNLVSIQSYHRDYKVDFYHQLVNKGVHLLLGFYPLEECGMHLLVWDDKLENYTLVFIAYGTILIAPASLIHGGGFRTSKSGNIRGHLYIYVVEKTNKDLKEELFLIVTQRHNEYLEGKGGIKEDGGTLCPMDSVQPPKVTTEETKEEEEVKSCRPKRITRQTQNDNEATKKKETKKQPPHSFQIDRLERIAIHQNWRNSEVLCGFVQHFLWKQKLKEKQRKSQTIRKNMNITREQSTAKKSKMEQVDKQQRYI